MKNDKIKILVIDDEKGFTDIFKICLERKDRYEVCCENDPANALATARDFLPDIVVLDVVMPGKDGADIARELKGDPMLEKVPTVFVTALADNIESGGKVFSNGMGEDWLAKPFQVDTLCDYIEQRVGEVERQDHSSGSGHGLRAAQSGSSLIRKIGTRAHSVFGASGESWSGYPTGEGRGVA